MCLQTDRASVTRPIPQTGLDTHAFPATKESYILDQSDPANCKKQQLKPNT